MRYPSPVHVLLASTVLVLLAAWPAQRAVIVTALLFAVLHIHPVGMVTAFTLGVLAGWQRVVFGTLWLPVVAHAVFNAHVLLWMYSPWMPNWPTWTWLLVGAGLALFGYDRLIRRAPAPAYSRP